MVECWDPLACGKVGNPLACGHWLWSTCAALCKSDLMFGRGMQAVIMVYFGVGPQEIP